MAGKYYKLERTGKTIEGVHESVLEAHKRAGWRVVGESKPPKKAAGKKSGEKTAKP